MVDAALAKLPEDAGFTIMYGLLAVAVLAAGVYIGISQFNTRYSTRIVKVEKRWPKPDRVVDGGQVNPQLAGMRCSIYEKRQTIVCEP